MSINNVLLLGGTGAIGTYLQQILDEREFDVYITSRSSHQDKGRIHYIICNAKEDEVLKRLCSKHWDVIVDFLSYKTNELANRLNTLLKATNQYVFLSSSRVFADEEHPIKETSPRLLDVSKDKDYLKTDEYALTKARQENLLINSNYKNWTIVRPYITYGDRRLQLGVLEKEEWLYRALHGRTVVFTKEIADRITSMANGYDVSLVISCLLGNQRSLGGAFNVATPERHRWEDIENIYSKILKEKADVDLKVKYVSVEDFISTRGKGLEYQVIYDRLFDRDFDSTKVNEYVDTGSFIKLEDGLKRCLANFLNQGCPFKSISWVHEARKDKLTHERTSLNEIPGLKNKINYITNRYL